MFLWSCALFWGMMWNFTPPHHVDVTVWGAWHRHRENKQQRKLLLEKAKCIFTMSETSFSWCVTTFGCDLPLVSQQRHHAQPQRLQNPTILVLFNQTQTRCFKVLTLKLERPFSILPVFSVGPWRRSRSKTWAGGYRKKKECWLQYRRSSQHPFPLNFLLPPSSSLKLWSAPAPHQKITFLRGHRPQNIFPYLPPPISKTSRSTQYDCVCQNHRCCVDCVVVSLKPEQHTFFRLCRSERHNISRVRWPRKRK